jgi:hypothetical protein
VTVDLLAGTATGGAGSDQLSGFEGILGSNHADTLTGTAANEILYGYGGADLITADAGNDRVAPGTGADNVALGNGNDTLIADSDWVGDTTADTIAGGAGLDTIGLLGSGLNLDLTAARFGDSRLESIERVDITGSGNNTLKIDSSQVMELTDLLASDAVLVIDGNVGDIVDLSNEGPRAADGTLVSVDTDGDGTPESFTTAAGAISANFGNGTTSYWVFSDATWGKLLVNTAVTIL